MTINAFSQDEVNVRAAWYSKNGEARDVLVIGDLPTPTPGPGEVRVKLATSGVNPSDVSQLLAGGLLLHTIGARFGLNEIAAAHQAVEGEGMIGNVIVELV